MIKISDGWNHPDAITEENIQLESGDEVGVLRVQSIHALNQLVGYVKYINRGDSRIYFRGQARIYPSLRASIFRDSKTTSSLGVRNSAIGNYITELSKAVAGMGTVEKYTIEPLLQHYGIKTRWIDLVDNLWIAIWFGLHDYKTQYFDRSYEFVYQRFDRDGYLYLLLMANDAFKESESEPGLFIGGKTSVIDLRVSSPSIFLRPHCQHAILMKSRVNDALEDVDLAQYLVQVIKISVRDAKEWLGTGRLITAENIFPPPVYDHGYGILLENAPYSKKKAKRYGSITNITYAVPGT
jgi:FRG domain-containing protein